MTAPSVLDKQFAELRVVLQQYGRSRFPALRNDIDDLVAQSLSDLWAYLKRRTDPSEIHTDTWVADIDPSTLRKVAFAIFKRRAADAYRQGARRWAMDSLETGGDTIADPSGGNADKAALLRRMLQVCVAELADASEEDQALLAVATGFGHRGEGAMDARGRQRLHRLRSRLALAIRRELGEDAAELLRGDW